MHPRLCTDATGTVPIKVGAGGPAALVADDVVRGLQGAGPGPDPRLPSRRVTTAQAEVKVELVETPEEGAAKCVLQSRQIYASRSTPSADSQRTSSTNTVLHGAQRRTFEAAAAAEGT